MIRFEAEHWALILGGSSGFGLASAKKLASHGMNVCVVHRDRQGSMGRIEAEFAAIRATGSQLLTFNLDALLPESRKRVLDGLADAMGEKGRIRTLLHSIAYGNLKPIAPPSHDPSALLIEDEDMARTIYSMGTSLLTWVQDLHYRKLFARDARVFGLTSEGNESVYPGYAAVSAAKLALESVARSIAVEYAPYGIRCNVLQPGVTDTPALRLIPGSEGMRADAERRNPFGRLTRPEDVAGLISLLSTDDAAWLNGSIVRVDGGERISGIRRTENQG